VYRVLTKKSKDFNKRSKTKKQNKKAKPWALPKPANFLGKSLTKTIVLKTSQFATFYKSIKTGNAHGAFPN